MKNLISTILLLCVTLCGHAKLKESVGSPDFSDWKSVKTAKDGAAVVSSSDVITYTYPEGKNSVKGFRAYYNGSDWSRYAGLSMEVYLEKESATKINLTFGVAEENAEHFEPINCAEVNLYGVGWNRVYVPWNLFSLNHGQRGTLQGVQSLTLSVESESNKKVQIRDVSLVKGETIALESAFQGGADEAGAEVTYELEVGNVSNETKTVQLSLPRLGWEAMTTTITPEVLTLAPSETKTVQVKVSIPESLPQGANEVQSIVAVANGNGAQSQTIDFTTSVRVESPFIVHTKDGWQEVIEKAQNYEWAQKELEKYDRMAAEWKVPAVAKELPSMNPHMGHYLYHSSQIDDLMQCAVAYKLTGKKEYAQKCLDVIRNVVDEKSGYPVTLRVNQNNFVKEGGVFQNIARTYDMIMDCGLLTDEDHRLIEQTFRLYIETAIMGNDDGGIGNWDLSELMGGLYCALMVQDFHLAKEIMYSPTGIRQQFVHGVMSDGWWYECSVGYNLWCATMFSEAAVALRPWGLNFLDEHIVIGKVPYFSLMPNRMKPGLYGMDFNKWGKIENNAIGIKQMWDALVPFLDYRGVMFAVNDAQETSVIGEPFEMAYYLFRDPEYASVIKMGTHRDLLYGVPELPDFESVKNKQSAYADNIGIVQLRSQTPDREQREQIQAALHYGSHGGYHGHFDRTNLLSMMRYGRSFYNPEMIWYGYQSYNYKFLVQTSMTKNMVVVDQKMQEPVESKRLLFYSGDMVQATTVETEARWCNPPYGGMRYGDKQGYSFQRKAWEEGRQIKFPEEEPEYGEITGYTEPILQRRMMVMMDDYIVLADYVDAEGEHTFDWLFQMKGFKGLDASKKEFVRRENQLSDDPLSAAQFFTNCEWFETQGTVRSSYEMLFGEGSDNAGTRAPNSEDGPIKIDVFNAWPQQNEVTVATVPESHGVAKQLWYEVEADGKVILSDSTGAWILGRKDISLDITGRKELVLKTKLKRNPSNNTIFWGNAKVTLANGKEMVLSKLPIKYNNTLQPQSKGMDYYGGPVKLGGEPMTSSLPGMPSDFRSEATIVVDLSGVDASKLECCIGGDYPLGDETQRRRTLNVRSKGEEARFLSVIEPYEATSVVKSVVASSADKLTVELKDGRTQEITIVNLEGEGDDMRVEVKEYKGGKLVREEVAQNKK
ncbi:MAG: hypothetical protein SNG02_01600 [Rikenellaceae bacterium]